MIIDEHILTVYPILIRTLAAMSSGIVYTPTHVISTMYITGAELGFIEGDLFSRGKIFIVR